MKLANAPVPGRLDRQDGADGFYPPASSTHAAPVERVGGGHVRRGVTADLTEAGCDRPDPISGYAPRIAIRHRGAAMDEDCLKLSVYLAERRRTRDGFVSEVLLGLYEQHRIC